MTSIYDFVHQNKIGILEANISFKTLTSLQIGGTCQYLFYPNDIEGLKKMLNYLKENKIAYFLIGNGTNLLINDGFFEGVVIKLKNLNKSEVISNNLIMIESGAQSMKIIREITKNGYGGLEFMATIPGTIGGMIYGNAGAYKKSIKDVLLCIDYLTEEGNVICLSKEDLQFSYRNSNLKQKKGIILRGYFLVNNDADPELIDYYMDIKKRTQPLNSKNAGSTFQNTADYHAWEIIDKLNCRGKKNGDAMVSEKHANFLINCQNASFEEMDELINEIKTKARKEVKTNLKLEWEVIRDF